MELGYTEIPVIVTTLSKQEAKKYRILDNKVVEYNSRNDHELGIELREFIDDDIMKQFYDMSRFEGMQDVPQEASDITPAQVERAGDRLSNQFAGLGTQRQEVPLIACPECGHEFRVG